MLRPKSAAAFERAQQVIPGGVNSPVRALRSVGTTPLFVSQAQGAYINDIDDNKFIDFCMSWGVFILGHNNQMVSQAAANAIMRGSSYGIPTEAETLVAMFWSNLKATIMVMPTICSWLLVLL